MDYLFSSLDELGEGYGFRKVRQALGITAFGVNALVMPPGFEGFLHQAGGVQVRPLGPTRLPQEIGH